CGLKRTATAGLGPHGRHKAGLQGLKVRWLNVFASVRFLPTPVPVQYASGEDVKAVRWQVLRSDILLVVRHWRAAAAARATTAGVHENTGDQTCVFTTHTNNERAR